MLLHNDHHPYIPAVKTNILETFRRHGWTPPSEDPAIQAKWSYFKSLSLLSEEALHHDSKN